MARTPTNRTKLTPPELARLWGVAAEKILTFIRSGELKAIDTAPRGSKRPRYRIDVADIAAFERARAANAPPPASKPARRRQKESGVIAFY